jgi:ornithine lipid ester-linked acyl 2-hydroxylase
MTSFGQIYETLKAKNREVVLGVGESLIRKVEQQFVQHSLIGDRTFFEPEQFAWIPGLEAHWHKIRQELDYMLPHRDELPNFQDIAKDEYRITQDNRWKTYFFYGFGIKMEQNCSRCPETTHLIESIPGMTTAFFSILLPHKQIPEHKGVYKGIIRYHLGLKVPEPITSCGIRVGGETRHWEEGKSLIFDDLYPHSAWNNSDDVRVVLFVDFLRPVSRPYHLFNQLILRLISWSPYVQDGKARQDQWNARLETLLGKPKP